MLSSTRSAVDASRCGLRAAMPIASLSARAARLQSPPRRHRRRQSSRLHRTRRRTGPRRADRAFRARPAVPASYASTMTAAGVPRDQPRSISVLAIAAERPSPISTTTVTPFGWSAATADWRTPLRRGRRRRGTRTPVPRCVTGMPAEAGAAIALRDARHDVVRHAGLLQRQRFLAAAAEHERIAALQPHDATSAPGGANHQRVNRGLRHRVPAGALADEEALRPPRILAGCARRPARHRARDPRRAGGPSPCASAAPGRRDRRRRATRDRCARHSHESSGAFSHGTPRESLPRHRDDRGDANAWTTESPPNASACGGPSS